MWITRMEGKWEFERRRVRGSGGGSEGEGREEDAKGAAGGEISVTEVFFFFFPPVRREVKLHSGFGIG